jgi:cellulose synthase/poly-beta-1,6-N-acetylglucosamine synthase-like glycosyltransferase
MIAILETILAAASLVLAVPVLVITAEVLASLAPRRVSPIPQGPRPRVAVLVPAHDEQAVIGKTLDSIGLQLTGKDRLVVVADNCSDATAETAQRHGAEVSERHDPLRRGKGYALAHGLDFLERSGPPDIVIFVDADCELSPGCIDRLALSSFHSRRPAQAAYLMNPPRTSRKAALLVSFAWTVKDLVRPLGWHRLGLPCQLAGSGMAFPWPVIRSADLASSHLAEDLKLGLDLALAGHFTLFVPDAVVTSDVAPGGQPTQSQRARWEHGTLDILVRYLPRLLLRLGKAPSLPLLALALDLSVPPLALLALALGADLALSLLVFVVFGVVLPMIGSGLVCGLFFLAIVLAWSRHGRSILPLRWLVFAPVYALLKVPLYGRFLLNRQRVWARGGR